MCQKNTSSKRRDTMKNWFSNSLFAIWIGSLLFGGDSFGRSASDGLDCLNQVDLKCAQDIRDELLQRQPNNDEVVQLLRRTLFHEGHYADLKALLESEAQNGETTEDTGGYPYLATVEAFEGMVVSTGKAVEVRHDPGIDRILAVEAIEVLEESRSTYDTLFGGGPDHDIVLDIFPTAKRFMMASGLPPESVRTTGVIALSKWNRLLLTSPRSTSRGYAWKDTTAHEYIHLVVAWRTKDNAPVWLQEGLAKYLEAAWRGERKNYLSAYQMSLLAKAIRDDSFVPFEKFARSMAYLDSSEEAALAFAQVATMVAFMQSKAGDSGFTNLMDGLRSGRSAEDMVSSLSGYSDFNEFLSAWKAYIRMIPLIQEELAELPVNLDGAGEDFDDDPLLGARQDLAKFARLGDLLLEADRPKAALIEYRKAIDEDEPPSPSIFARRSQCHMALGDVGAAQRLIDEGVRLYPEFPMLLKSAGDVYRALNQPEKSIAFYRLAHDINPYQVELQQLLISQYEASGQTKMADHHRYIQEILKAGGAYEVPPSNGEE